MELGELVKNFFPFRSHNSNYVVQIILQREKIQFEKWQKEKDKKAKSIGLRSIFYLN